MTKLQNKPKRILLAEDSAVMRQLIRSWLGNNRGYTIVGQASDGKEAAEMAAKFQPDLVLMDLFMGDYDGLYGVEQIMKSNCPCPILLLSAASQSEELLLKALAAGATDVLAKPSLRNGNLQHFGLELDQKIKAALATNLAQKPQAFASQAKHSFSTDLPYEMLLLGASTGGPATLEFILAQLPENWPLPIVIAQHMPQAFLPAFARRLQKMSKLKVSMAQNGERPKPNQVYLAPGDYHLLLRGTPKDYLFAWSQRTHPSYNYPSVDALFESAAELIGKSLLGVLLTGMGSDGAKGLLAIKEAGGFTINQDEASSSIYGMPRAAQGIGASRRELPLSTIPPFLVQLLDME
ncbi:chemotaxis response regulator containing a CheY-like receiver domain and a methylesterase domain [Saprospira grandis DSM 2844]|uniref:Protein-glutamate methylesterase/protein-glutamine glutaminase n=1 Tax=Saprospira grandis DSM 2844 TaxID=694433 RepID=J0P471_9BACT|nr:chemotaxis-specific protein-glutamate methyltransferase CheB [Saprospira grandis]EJF52212.1 chemotaxis response regulator containing a CheY-like receiver domain and a methylesterase domain [Saprospira grandis DSM 2844]